MKKWEYKVESPLAMTEQNLNRLGQSGWELIYINPSTPTSLEYPYGDVVVFKREIPEFAPKF